MFLVHFSSNQINQQTWMYSSIETLKWTKKTKLGWKNARILKKSQVQLKLRKVANL